jgi:ABC-type lipopolysaccharide export system ATPase subunit
MIGDTKQMARLQKAMNTTQFTAFKNLMDVFEATGRSTNFNSSTVRQQAGRDMLEGATLGGEVAKTIVNPNPITLLSRAQEGIQNLINEGNVSRIVDVLTNGDSIKELLKISSRSTGRDKAAMAVMKAFNLARTQAETHLGGTLGEDAYNTELGN